MNQEDLKQYNYWGVVRDKFKKKKNLNPSQRNHFCHAKKMIKKLEKKSNF